MLIQIRIWVAALGFSLGAVTAQAQTQLPALPNPAPTTAVAPAPTTGSAALQRPTEVSGKYKNYLLQRYANDTEALAIIKRYSHKQTGGGLWLGIGAGAIAAIASQTGTNTTSSGTTTFTVSPLGYGILVGLFGGVGIGKLVRFNNQKLFEALMAHDQQAGFPGRTVSSLPTTVGK